MNMRKLKERGDTIVEVLIAMTVASSVLGVTYATMNRNIITARANQERTEADKLIQGQLESLKNLSLPATVDTIVDADHFCINGSSIVSLAATVPNANVESDDLSLYQTCVSTNGLYHYVIVHDGPVGSNQYKLYVRWDRLGGGPRNQIVMVYRI
jgi:type II secretory pathway pseudopilin PulG